jgi:ferric-dicitrate binding protein FerR (iron transport regulator)
MTNDRARMLIMTVLDGEHTPEDLRELEALAAASPEVRDEWARFARVKEVTRTMAWPEPPPETWDRYWMSVYNRTERKIGWLLLLAGGLLVVAWQLWEAAPRMLRNLFEDESIPLPVRIAIVVAGVGAIMLVLSVVREQLTARRKDRYAKGVTR